MADASFEEIASFWKGQLSGAVPELVSTESEPAFSTASGKAQTVFWKAEDGQVLKARMLEPARISPLAVVCAFHDAGRPVRGWHHLGRWLALGCAVLSPERRFWSEDVCEGYVAGAPASLALIRQEKDAAEAMLLARRLFPSVPLIVYGEGLGAGLGVAAAGALEGRGADLFCILNPLPCALRRVWEKGMPEGIASGLIRYFREKDPLAKTSDDLFRTLSYAQAEACAPAIGAPVLFGTSGLDSVTPPEVQDVLASALSGPVTRNVYPRWAHERVNAFEDATFSFVSSWLMS